MVSFIFIQIYQFLLNKGLKKTISLVNVVLTEQCY